MLQCDFPRIMGGMEKRWDWHFLRYPDVSEGPSSVSTRHADVPAIGTDGDDARFWERERPDGIADFLGETRE